MYTSEAKIRRSQAMLKSTRNSKNLQNIQHPTSINSKMKEQEGVSRAKTINSKSKFTVLKSLKQPSSLVSLDSKQITEREYRKPYIAKKSNIPVTSTTKCLSANKNPINNASLNKRAVNRKNRLSPQGSLRIEPVLNEIKEITEMGIQTNENEILNHSLIVGDLKIVLPSKSLTDKIDKVRQENETKKLLMATRKFEEHSLQEEQHLDDLKEFLDKNYITRRPNKLSDILEEDRKIIKSMDDLLQRERPKIESITDIKLRIKHKEQELLNLFDHFQKKTELISKTKV